MPKIACKNAWFLPKKMIRLKSLSKKIMIRLKSLSKNFIAISPKCGKKVETPPAKGYYCCNITFPKEVDRCNKNC